MISPAKLNLGLEVLYKRPDSYHEIRSIFIRTNWGDEIYFTPNETKQIELISVNLLPIPQYELFEDVSERGNFKKNILYKAWEFICDIIGQKEGVTIHLTKRIPPGGGLGGGSSNAASLIEYFFNQHSIKINSIVLEKISRIGADIPFFLGNSHALVGGIGEKIQPINLAPGRGIICIPKLQINTTELYSKLKKPLQKHPSQEPWDKLEQGIRESLEKGNWNFFQGKLENEFEKVVFNEYPELAEIKEKLLELGSDFSSMTGSGSCIFALCRDAENLKKIALNIKQVFLKFEWVLFEF